MPPLPSSTPRPRPCASKPTGAHLRLLTRPGEHAGPAAGGGLLDRCAWPSYPGATPPAPRGLAPEPRLSGLLVALRRAGVAVRLVDSLPPDATPVWCAREQVSAFGMDLLVLRQAELAHEDLWALIHEAAHAIVPGSQQRDEDECDLRAEVLGPFLADERRLARAVAATAPRALRHLEPLIVARQIEDLDCALRGNRFSPPSRLSPAQAATAQKRLRYLQRRYGQASQIEVLREHQAAQLVEPPVGSDSCSGPG